MMCALQIRLGSSTHSTHSNVSLLLLRRSPHPPRATRGTVVLTREAGSNEKVRKMLDVYGVDPIELPLIEFAMRPELESLGELLSTRRPDWIVLTSPQSARVFLRAWEYANQPLINIATFQGTMKVLRDSLKGDLRVGFVSEVANAKHLGDTLPKAVDKRVEEVLYPASSKADDTLERTLRQRHFVVTRLDTYETSTVDLETLNRDTVALARSADVLTFASPTAVNAWIGLMDSPEETNFDQPVACIGSTTANRARSVGFKSVYFSDNPGLDGLVHSIITILTERGIPVTRTEQETIV